MDLERQITKALEGDLTKLNEAEQRSLLQASYKLASAIETPFDRIYRMLFVRMSKLELSRLLEGVNNRKIQAIYDPVVIRIALDLSLIDIISTNGGKITIPKLAEESKADINLVQRIVRMLVPLGVMVQDGEGECSLTPLASALVEGSPFKDVMIHITHLYPAISSMPDYFATHNFQNPVDALDAPFDFAFRCKGKNYFDYLATPGNERIAKAFNTTMEMKKSQADHSFITSYPVRERLRIDDPQRVLLVDVGGNLGHQVRKFQETFPGMTGRYVLEDLPEVVAQVTDLPCSTTKVGHDFFTPQPDDVKHAKAYYLRTILHDWPETQARTILRYIVGAMADDSVVLIHEVIMPETGVGHTDATMDWHMMTLGALERTEKQWADLGDSVGLKLNGIWMDTEDQLGTRGLIEFAKKL